MGTPDDTVQLVEGLEAQFFETDPHRGFGTLYLLTGPEEGSHAIEGVSRHQWDELKDLRASERRLVVGELVDLWAEGRESCPPLQETLDAIRDKVMAEERFELRVGDVMLLTGDLSDYDDDAQKAMSAILALDGRMRSWLAELVTDPDDEQNPTPVQTYDSWMVVTGPGMYELRPSPSMRWVVKVEEQRAEPEEGFNEPDRRLVIQVAAPRPLAPGSDPEAIAKQIIERITTEVPPGTGRGDLAFEIARELENFGSDQVDESAYDDDSGRDD